MGRFIRLDVVHRRVHIHDHDIVKIPDHVDKRDESAIARFNPRGLVLSKRLSFVDVFEPHHDVAEGSFLAGIERLQQSPAPSIGDASAIDRVRQRCEVVSLRLGDIADQRDGAGE
jgi:hypothetical protein